MAGTALTGASVAELMVELAGIKDLGAREVNEKHGDDHGGNLGKLRAVAKPLKTQHEHARDLWETGDTTARMPPSWSAVEKHSDAAY
jgi:3-methyladenine DNA glycosylase AlkD